MTSRPYHSKYGLFSGDGDLKEDLRAKQADKEIDEALKKLKKDLKKINSQFGDLGLTDTEVRGSISGAVGNIIFNLE